MNINAENSAGVSQNNQEIEQLVNELKQCWDTYIELKRKADSISGQEGVPHELIGTVNQAASQQLTESVRNVLLKHASMQSEKKREENESKTGAGTGGDAQKKKKSKYWGERMYRVEHDKMLAGVCGGLAEYFNIESNIIRVIFVVTSFFPMGLGVIAYIALAIILPLKSTETPESPPE